jgi:hypothetical protein
VPAYHLSRPGTVSNERSSSRPPASTRKTRASSRASRSHGPQGNPFGHAATLELRSYLADGSRRSRVGRPGRECCLVWGMRERPCTPGPIALWVTLTACCGGGSATDAGIGEDVSTPDSHAPGAGEASGPTDAGDAAAAADDADAFPPTSLSECSPGCASNVCEYPETSGVAADASGPPPPPYCVPVPSTCNGTPNCTCLLQTCCCGCGVLSVEPWTCGYKNGEWIFQCQGC